MRLAESLALQGRCDEAANLFVLTCDALLAWPDGALTPDNVPFKRGFEYTRLPIAIRWLDVLDRGDDAARLRAYVDEIRLDPPYDAYEDQ